jgi:hypothetical protein
LINVQPEEKKTVESVELLCCSDVEVLVGKAIRKCSSVGGRKKKSAWTDLDRVSFKKFVKESNVEIEKSAWTDLGKVKKGLFSGKCLYECSTWVPPKRFALRWPEFDKRCRSC